MDCTRESRLVDDMLTRKLGENFFSIIYENINLKLHSIPIEELRILLEECIKTTRTNPIRDNFFLTGHVLVSSLPYSSHLLHGLLRRSSRFYRELQFHIFFAMSSIESIPAEVSSLIEHEIVEFLLNAKDNNQHAAWMASHCLGDHWDEDGALSALLTIINNHRYKISYSLAKIALGDLAGRAKSPSTKTIISEIL